jgi:hypothetical protein
MNAQNSQLPHDLTPAQAVPSFPAKSDAQHTPAHYAIGVFSLLHVIASIVLLYLRLEGFWGSYAYALMPLFALACEMVIVTTIPIVIMYISPRGVTWEALTNLLISLLVSISVLIVMFGIFRGEILGW